MCSAYRGGADRRRRRGDGRPVEERPDPITGHPRRFPDQPLNIICYEKTKDLVNIVSNLTREYKYEGDNKTYDKDKVDRKNGNSEYQCKAERLFGEPDADGMQEWDLLEENVSAPITKTRFACLDIISASAFAKAKTKPAQTA